MVTKKQTLLTANFLDRESNLKWLTRNPGEKVSKSVAHSAVIATGVEFKESTVEKAYGCFKVAHCETVTPYKAADMPRPAENLHWLKMHCGFFYDENTDEEVTKVAELRLNPDGSMWYATTVASNAKEKTEQPVEEMTEA